MQVHLQRSLRAGDTCLETGQECVRLNVAEGIWDAHCLDISHMRSLRTEARAAFDYNLAFAFLGNQSLLYRHLISAPGEKKPRSQRGKDKGEATLRLKPVTWEKLSSYSRHERIFGCR